jgi:hypothetical protein
MAMFSLGRYSSHASLLSIPASTAIPSSQSSRLVRRPIQQ